MPQLPAVSGPAVAPGLRGTTRAAFTADGALARAIPGYEPREGQRQMAVAVADVLEEGGVLLAEAGTGTGKTVAYLVPAILSRHRVLVSTGTKNLQEQIFTKDLPALREALGVPFRATLMKGRSNYLCLHRWAHYRDAVDSGTHVGRRSGGHHAPRLIESGDRVLLPIVDAWVKTTQTGDRAELRDVPEDLPLWKEIAADVTTCLGTTCPRYADCFVTQMRQRAAESDVVIVNHHLLCADAAVRQSAYGEVIPACPTLVVDEAHQLEDAATQYFGLALSTFRLEELVRDVQAIGSLAVNAAIPRVLADVAQCGQVFFAAAAEGARVGDEGRARYDGTAFTDDFEAGTLLAGALERLEAALTAHGRPPVPGELPPEGSDDTAALQRRAGEFRTDLRRLLRADDAAYVYYVERRGRGVFLRASPIEVSRVVREALFDRFRTVVLTSATLAVDGSFDYLRGRLGIRTAEEVRVASEFDYATQALLYLPARMPLPQDPDFAQAVAREATDLLHRSQGRAFVLFTSYAVLRTVQRVLEMTLPYPLLVQGSAPRSALIETFRATPHAVLLATSSFWQGVDVVGEALSCVIVDKLPFTSPGDPIVAARIEAIRAAGGDAFSDYQVPLAILALQQGLGRLLRHRTDRGVLAVFDPRITTRSYGQRFLGSLPPAPVTSALADVELFFR